MRPGRPPCSREQDAGCSTPRIRPVRRDMGPQEGRRLVGFYAVMYFAGLRSSEAVGLRKADCFLPESEVF